MDLIVSSDGIAVFGAGQYRCAVGRGGIRADKREGDGASPVGRFRLEDVFYRPDRLGAPATTLPVAPLRETDGWCDDPAHPDYNRKVALPHPARCERLWRDDALYDIVVATDHNTGPAVPGAGSAIFVHVAGGPDYPPTEGCVAFALPDLRTILAAWTAADRLVIVEG